MKNRLHLSDAVRRAAVSLWAGLAGVGLACDTPVFHYALTHWMPARYTLSIFTEDVAPVEQELARLIGKDEANLRVHIYDLTRPLPEGAAALRESGGDRTSPWMVLHAPAEKAPAKPGDINEEGRLSSEVPKPGPSVKAAAYTPDELAALLRSPARIAANQKIVRGVSVVWLLVQSGNEEKDRAAFDLLESASAEFRKSIALPPGAVDTQPFYKRPPRVDFAIVPAGRKDPAERWFTALLQKMEQTAETATEPMVFPLFGRGRILPPLSGRLLTRANLESAARYLLGPCSCTVRDQNPGMDIFYAGCWCDPEPIPLYFDPSKKFFFTPAEETHETGSK